MPCTIVGSIHQLWLFITQMYHVASAVAVHDTEASGGSTFDVVQLVASRKPEGVQGTTAVII